MTTRKLLRDESSTHPESQNNTHPQAKGSTLAGCLVLSADLAPLLPGVGFHLNGLEVGAERQFKTSP